MKIYHVVYERDASGWWVASVRGVRGCHTQGRTVDEARRRIAEALELFVINAAAKIVDDVRLPKRATKAIRTYVILRKKADRTHKVCRLRGKEETAVDVQAPQLLTEILWIGISVEKTTGRSDSISWNNVISFVDMTFRGRQLPRACRTTLCAPSQLTSQDAPTSFIIPLV